MLNWHEVLKDERRSAQPGDPFAQPPRYNWCVYYQGIYYQNNPLADGESIPERRAKALDYALKNLPLTLPEYQQFFGGAETFRSAALLSGITHDEYENAENAFYSQSGIRFFTIGHDHAIPDYNTLMDKGLGDFIRRASRQTKLVPGPEINAMLIALKAIRDFAVRTAAFWRSRRPETADHLEWISENPPRNIIEALQLMWLIFVVFESENRHHNALGRMDQYLYRAWRSGNTGRAETLEAICQIFAKVEGFHEVTNICIGGVTPEGNDAANELSLLILEATGMVHSASTNLSARLHKYSTDEFLGACVKLIRTGIGFPAVFNDSINIPMLEKLGIPTAAARDYALVGCVECVIPGRQVAWSDGRFNMPSMFTLAMEQLEECADFDALWDKFSQNMKHGIAQYHEQYNELLSKYPANQYSDPLLSALTGDCIQRAKDINDGGARFMRLHGIGMIGLATLVDSFAAVKKLVFEQKRISAAELVTAIRKNFAGHEELRQTLLHCAPKYGNDDEVTNQLAAQIVNLCGTLCRDMRTIDGGFLQSCMASNTSNIPAGAETGATPDGRFATTPLSDAASPTGGRDRKGPTAFLNSVLTPDYEVQNCTVVNMRFLPEMFDCEGGCERMIVLLRKFIESGGHELQFNVTDNNQLREAMDHPDDYGDLIVRVSGFSAFFTKLNREVQQDIIQRTAHGKS